MKGNGYRKDKTRPNVSFEKLLVHCDAFSAVLAFITRVPISQDQEQTKEIEPEPVKIIPSSVLTPSG